MLKHADRVLLAFFLIASISSLGLGVALWLMIGAGIRLIATAGLLFTLTGLLQIEVSGFFAKVLEIVADEEKHPFGPPSHIAREIIDDPERPIRTFFRNKLLFDPRTGFWSIFAGTVVQIAAVWL